MRVARIARIMTWNLYMGVNLGIVSSNTQQDVEMHTHPTGCGRRTGVWNINGSVIKLFMRFTHLKEQRCEYVRQ